jgi:hypothetical protein
MAFSSSPTLSRMFQSHLSLHGLRLLQCRNARTGAPPDDYGVVYRWFGAKRSYAKRAQATDSGAARPKQHCGGSPRVACRVAPQALRDCQ